MGLDMFLKKKKKNCKRTIEEICNGDYEEYNRDLSEIAYWRKVNQVHKWFVDNVQNGVDDCNYYLVSKEQIIQLRDICKEILNNVELVDSKVINGWKTVDGKMVENYEDGKMIKNPEICERLLPTQEGFFFGNYEYNQLYLDGIEYTYNILNAILDILDFDDYEVYYGSSW